MSQLRSDTPRTAESVRAETLAAVLRIARGVDGADKDLILSGYRPDGHDDNGDFRGSAEGFADWVIGLTQGAPFVQHAIENHQILAMSETQAVCETYYMARVPGNDGGLGISCGRYVDIFELRGGKWLIAQRRVTVEGATPNLGFDTEKNERGTRDRSDLSYALIESIVVSR